MASAHDRAGRQGADGQLTASSTSGVEQADRPVEAVDARVAACRTALGVGLLDRRRGTAAYSPGRRAATRVPLPWRLRARPASAVGRRRRRSSSGSGPSSRASSRSAGRRVPGGRRPSSMARASAAASCSLRGSAPCPWPEEVDEQSAPRPSTAFSVHLASIGYWTGRSCASNDGAIPVQCQDDPAPTRTGWTRKEGRST